MAVDALGRTVLLPAPPRRIVSLVPSITETLFAFGLGDALAGITNFCLEPRGGVAGKPKVGGTKDPDVPRIMALAPDLVIANVEENGREEVERLIAAGLTVFVTYPRTVSEGIEMMRQIAALTGAGAAARPFIQDAESELRLSAAEGGGRRAVRVFCPIWRRVSRGATVWMTIGADTYMHDVIRACGGENVFGERSERYPEVTREEVTSRRPEVILLPDEPYRFRERHVPELAALDVPAARDGRVYLVEGKALSWYGCRIGESLRRLRGLLREPPGRPPA